MDLGWGWGVITSDQIADSRNATLTLGLGGVGWGGVGCDNVGSDCRLPQCHADLGVGWGWVGWVGGVGWGVITSDQIADSRNATLTSPVSKYKLQNTTVQFRNTTI